jgi:hypothetical protein
LVNDIVEQAIYYACGVVAYAIAIYQRSTCVVVYAVASDAYRASATIAYAGKTTRTV